MSYRPGPTAPGYVPSGGSVARAAYSPLFSADLGSGVVTATAYERVWALIQVTGHNAANPVPQAVAVTGNITQENALNLAAPVAATSRPFSFWTSWYGSSAAPYAGWTELMEAAGAPLRMEAQWQPNTFDTVPGVYWTGNQNPALGIGLEVASAGGAIAASVLASGGGTTGNSQATASVTPAANSLLLLAVSSGQGTLLPPTITGLGLTWTLVKTGTSQGQRLTVYRAQAGASPATGTVSWTWPNAYVGDTGVLQGWVWPSGNWRDALIEVTFSASLNFGGGSGLVLGAPGGADAPMAQTYRHTFGRWSLQQASSPAALYGGPVTVDPASGLFVPYVTGTASSAQVATGVPVSPVAGDKLTLTARYPVA